MTEQITAQTLTQAIREVADNARSEEDVRVGVEHALSHALETIGLQRTAEYEKTTFSGSMDAVYGHVVIEYKRPGRMQEAGFPAKLAQQLSKYLLDFARKTAGKEKQAEALEKLIGIGMDAAQIMFLRYSASGRERDLPTAPLPGTQASFYDISGFDPEGPKGGFQAIGPVPITNESVGLLLLYLRSLSRKPLTPEALAAEFGPQSEIARHLVNAFYQALQEHRDQPHVATLFAEWQRIFGIVYGEELGDAQKDAPELAGLYDVPVRAGHVAPLQTMFFAVHTYYALLMKFLAVELASLQEGALVGSFAAVLPSMPDRDLRHALTELENGGTFVLLGINNFLEGDFFGWYLDVWDEALGSAIRAMSHALSDFEPATSTLEPEHTRDLLKKLYQYLVPKKLRHDLGEYYTPDWLAERLLNQVGYHGEIDKRLIDPGCGSGTFPILALRRLRQYAADHLVEPANILDAALHNIVAFDLNPLSVIAARTNYLLALGDLLRFRRGNIDIPVYLCDSILTPSEQADMFGKSYRLHTVVGDFDLPGEVVTSGEMARLAKLVEDCVRNDYSPGDFVARAKRELTITEPNTHGLLEALYRRFLTLEKEGRDGIWARIIKNAFAPVLVGQFDFVMGNPPWVNWECLSQEYRDATKKLWEEYGLFTLSGHAARLGGGKKDLSMLFTYVAADKYLKKGGKLGFVITQTVFKTKGAGDGFRRFRIGARGDHLGVLQVDDMSRLQPFEGATNRTAVVVLQRGSQSRYPVPYTVWKKGDGSARVDINKYLQDVLAETHRSDLWAQPVDGKTPTSPWMNARKAALKALQKVVAPSHYQAYSGACTWFNAIYWIEILDRRPDGKLVIQNLPDIGRAKAKQVRRTVESDLIYPLLRGRDITKWRSAPSLHLLLTQNPATRTGIDEKWLKLNLPETYAFLVQFRGELLKRSGYKKFFEDENAPFYTIYNVGPYTMSEHKVGWAREDASLRCAVFGLAPFENGTKCIIPDQTVQFIDFDDEQEAHFVCALLNSTPATIIPKSYTTDITTHVLSVIGIPEFSSGNPLHSRLSVLSVQAHEAAAAGKDTSSIETAIDLAAAELWDISTKELEEIKESLELL